MTGSRGSYLVNRSYKFHTTPAYRFIHRHDCQHVPLNRGPRWCGPFDTLREAMAWAQNTGDTVKLCNRCKPGSTGVTLTDASADPKARRRDGVYEPRGWPVTAAPVNPWSGLPTHDAPHVLQQDLPIVEAFNKRYAHDPDIKIQSHLLPEPFIGDPSARVYLLNLNPGYSPKDDDWHRKPVYRNAIIENLGHKTAEYPFYFLDPRLQDAPGSAWWIQRSRWWIRDVGTKTLARNLFCAELFPYHSTKYRPIPKRISRISPDSPDGLVPSSGYVAHLVREAIRDHRPIVVRTLRWCELIPELGDYSKLFHLNSRQNVSLSPNNLQGYDQLVAELRAVPPPRPDGAPRAGVR